jgi:hypothetical protein
MPIMRNMCLEKALADTGASSCIILEAYTSKDIIKQDKD